MYQGPRVDVLGYFESLGYCKPNHMDKADFLQDLLTNGLGSESPKHYKESDFFKCQLDQIEISKQVLAEDSPFQVSREYLVTAPEYIHGFFKMTQLLLARQARVLLRNRRFLGALLTQNIVMGLLIGLLCFQLPFNQYYIKTTLLFQLLMFAGFSSMPLIPNL